MYIVNGKERKAAESSLAQLQTAIRESTPATPGGAFKITSLPATPAAAAIVWQGKSVPGRVCKSRIEMTGLSTPVSLEHTLETHTTDLAGELAAAEAARASLDLGVQLQLVKPSFPEADRLETALAPCFPPGRLLVRMHLTMVGQGLPVRTSLRHEVTALRVGKCLDVCGCAAAMKGYNQLEAPRAALLSQAGLPAEPNSAGLLKQVDELKRLIETEQWEQARSLESQISMSIYRRAEAAKPPPARKFEVEEAAGLALQLGDLEKTHRHARQMAASSRDDVGHTLLGLLAWRSGDKQLALSQLVEAGKRADTMLVSLQGARMELTEKLAEDGEYQRVAEYIEACRRGSKVRPDATRMYERALEALRAKTKPYFTHSFRRYELPAPAR